MYFLFAKQMITKNMMYAHKSTQRLLMVWVHSSGRYTLRQMSALHLSDTGLETRPRWFTGQGLGVDMVKKENNLEKKIKKHKFEQTNYQLKIHLQKHWNKQHLKVVWTTIWRKQINLYLYLYWMKLYFSGKKSGEIII